jgi:hypothetical protein
VKIHLSMTTLEPRGRGISSHVPLLIWAPYSSIVVHQFGSMRAARAEVGMADGGVKGAVATRVSQSQGSRKSSLAHVIIRCRY